jgi:PTS system mannose-specific IIC component
MLGVTIAMATAWIGGWSMVQHRHLLARLARPLQPAVREGSARTIQRIQYTGIVLDALRAALITGVGALVALPVALHLMSRWQMDATLTRALLVIGVAAVAASALWRLFHAVSVTRRLFITGLLLGTLGVVVYG